MLSDTDFLRWIFVDLFDSFWQTPNTRQEHFATNTIETFTAILRYTQAILIAQIHKRCTQKKRRGGGQLV